MSHRLSSCTVPYTVNPVAPHVSVNSIAHVFAHTDDLYCFLGFSGSINCRVRKLALTM